MEKWELQIYQKAGQISSYFDICSKILSGIWKYYPLIERVCYKAYSFFVEKDKILNDDFDKIAYPLIELGWELGEYIHPILYTFKDWKKRCFTPFYKNIEKEGIVL